MCFVDLGWLFASHLKVVVLMYLIVLLQGTVPLWDLDRLVDGGGGAFESTLI